MVKKLRNGKVDLEKRGVQNLVQKDDCSKNCLFNRPVFPATKKGKVDNFKSYRSFTAAKDVVIFYVPSSESSIKTLGKIKSLPDFNRGPNSCCIIGINNNMTSVTRKIDLVFDIYFCKQNGIIKEYPLLKENEKGKKVKTKEQKYDFCYFLDENFQEINKIHRGNRMFVVYGMNIERNNPIVEKWIVKTHKLFESGVSLGIHFLKDNFPNGHYQEAVKAVLEISQKTRK